MNTPNILGAEETLLRLTPLIQSLYHALEAATQEARLYFDQRKEPADPFLFPCLVRYHAKLILNEAGQNANYELDDLANNGLYLRYAGFQIRVLKSDNGRLPVPGASKQKQEFYNQQLSFGFMEANSGNPENPILNLVVLWDVTSRQNLEPLILACPKAGSETRESVEEHWQIEIPHPAQLIAATDTQQTDELEITLKQSARKLAINND